MRRFAPRTPIYREVTVIAEPLSPAQVHTWLQGQRDKFLDELMTWVRIPSIAGPPEHEMDLRHSAQWLAGTLREMGFPTVQLWGPDSTPAVWAQWCAAPGAATVLVYSHHDVRTVKQDLWEQCAPFDPVVHEGRLYGRGTSDAKGQVLAHLWGLRAYLAAGHESPPINIKFLIDGEEEVGSPHLREMLDKHGGSLAADFVIVTDTMTWSANEPAVCVSNRGLVEAQLEVTGPLNDVHAGAVAGAAPNPALELAAVLAQLHHPDGRVAIEGFYDEVAEPSDVEREALARLTSDEQAWLARTRTRAVAGEQGRSLGEKLYTRPSLEVLALTSGDPAPPSRGVIPSLAGAELHLSLVPHQDPDTIAQLLRDWLTERVPDRVEYTLTVAEQINQPPYATPHGHPAVLILAEAMEQAWDRSVGRMGNAGSGPADLLSDKVGAPVLFFGTGLPEDRWHSSDESVHLGVLFIGAATMALFWPRLAEKFKPASR
jgi:acetylornithine deacetylase/succinyl-diaminopimelate desuccinylase-like protein